MTTDNVPFGILSPVAVGPLTPSWCILSGFERAKDKKVWIFPSFIYDIYAEGGRLADIDEEHRVQDYIVT